MSELATLGAFSLAGVALGFVFQRSRLCFVSAVRDLILFRALGMTRAILLLMTVVSLGGAGALAVRAWMGWPAAVYDAPSSWPGLLGGAVFGFGMVLAGSCGAGSLWRLGEGQQSQLYIIAGLFLGTWLYTPVQQFATDTGINLPVNRWTQAALMAALLLIVVWLDRRRSDAGEELREIRMRKGFRAQWTPETGALATAGMLVVFLVLTGQVWQVSRAFTLTDHNALVLAVGIVAGGYLGARVGREWRIRRAGTIPQILVRLGGGLLMGYSARMSWGCTVGVLMGGLAVASAQVWWWFGGALAGAWGGTLLLGQLFRRYKL
ncbi:MAG TPA: YeeE/YedE thiosulfate transporter family protein [Symbiobacteriaceae bacterium]|jgi:hypothetical protein